MQAAEGLQGSSFDSGQFLGRESALSHQQAAVPTAEGMRGSGYGGIWAAHYASTMDSQRHSEMSGTEGSILRKEAPALFLCNGSLPWKGR